MCGSLVALLPFILFEAHFQLGIFYSTIAFTQKKVHLWEFMCVCVCCENVENSIVHPNLVEILTLGNITKLHGHSRMRIFAKFCVFIVINSVYIFWVVVPLNYYCTFTQIVRFLE